MGGMGCINSVRPSAGNAPLSTSESPPPHDAGGARRQRPAPFYYSEGVAPIQAVDISEDSRTLVAVSNHGTVFAWDPSGRGTSGSVLSENVEEMTVESLLRPITKFRAHAPGTYCLHAKIAPDCRHLVTTGRYVLVRIS